MPIQETLLDPLDDRLTAFLAEQRRALLAISPDLTPLVTLSERLLHSGKRFRPQFCYLTWRGVLEAWNPVEWEDLERDLLPMIVDVCLSLELFQGAALVHDDIIDHSDQRRGAPSAHRAFEQLHNERGWPGSGLEFGNGSALLLGDLLLMWSSQVFHSALESTIPLDSCTTAKRLFHRMCTEVTAGQYLDIREEYGWVDRSPADSVAQARLINTYKSARYSIEFPMLIGATLAGANQQQLASFSAFGLRLGQAYQLRDDVLGVFGDPAITGKPSGDDLREGKRTALIALTRERVPHNVLTTIDELLGDPALDAEQIAMLQATVKGSGALATIETEIESLRLSALEALDTITFSGSARAQLEALAKSATRRVF